MMQKKVKDGVGYRLTAEGTRPEVLPPLSWKSPASSGYFHISDFQHGCTRVHLCRAKSTKKHGRNENRKMAKKSGIEKEPAAGWSFSGGSLQSSCQGFAAVDFGYSAPSRPAGQQGAGQQGHHQVFPSLADNHTQTDCEGKEPFLSRAPEPAGRC